MVNSGAAAVIVGNELLSAKVVDENGALLIRRLRERGVALRWLAMVPDEVDAIVEALSLARRRARYLFTSGGIGPTHDDVTVRAVGVALGRPVVRHPQMERIVREHYGAGASPEAMRMAEAPEGTELILLPGAWYPALCCDQVYMLPGVPQLFRRQLEAVLPRLEAAPLVLRCLFLGAGEVEIAPALDRVVGAMPEVSFGSYPAWGEGEGYRVKLTVEHSSAETAQQAVDRLVRELPEGCIVRVE